KKLGSGKKLTGTQFWGVLIIRRWRRKDNSLRGKTACTTHGVSAHSRGHATTRKTKDRKAPAKCRKGSKVTSRARARRPTSRRYSVFQDGTGRERHAEAVDSFALAAANRGYRAQRTRRGAPALRGQGGIVGIVGPDTAAHRPEDPQEVAPG